MDPVAPSPSQAPVAPQQAAAPAPVPPTAPPTLPPEPGPQIAGHPKAPNTLAIVALLLLLLLGGGGFTYALYAGKISLPFLSKQPTVDEMADALSAMSSARIGVELTAVAEARAAGVEPVSVAKLTAEPKKEGEEEEEEAFKIDFTSMILNAFPSDATVSLSTTTDWSAAGEAKADTETSVKGSFSSSGLTMEFDGAARAVNGTTYLMINKLPLPFIDVSLVAGKWIRLPKEAGSSLTSVMGMGTAGEDVRVFAPKEDAAEKAEEKKSAGSFHELRVLFAELVNDGAIAVTAVDEDAEVAGAAAWRLDLSFNPVKYRSTFIRLHGARSTLFPGAEEFDVFTDEAVARLNDAELAAESDKLAKGMTLALFVDKKTRMPSRIDIRAPLALSEEDAPKLAGKQITFGVAVTLGNVNKPVVIAAPTDAISMTQAQNLMTGRSEAEAKYDLQTSIVSDLRKALEAYHGQFKKYPATLDDLKGLEYDSMADFESLAGKYVQVVVDVPNDQYAGSPFAYSLVGDGYELKYRLGPNPKADEEDAGFSMFTQQYVDGVNTATPEAVSVEGDALKNKDTDGDGLPDREESRLGTSPTKADTDGDGLSDGDEESEYYTSPTKADTDGDGFSDGDEVKGGFDPLENSTTKERVGGTVFFLDEE